LPLLAAWGKNDPFFIPPGAEAYKRDLPKAEVHFLDTGHFALETRHAEIAALMRDFLPKATKLGALFKSQGMKDPMPRIQMLDGFNEGWIEFEGGEAGSVKGQVELETVLRSLVERAA
jgi:hypothetical protein